MDPRRFDSLAKLLARPRTPRRSALKAGGLALGAITAAAAAEQRGTAALARQATPAAEGPPAAINIDGTWFCDQTYAPCNTAVCERAADDPSVGECPCVVLTGYSMGFKTCDERAQDGTSLWSTFSAANVNSEFGILSCPADAAWVNCLDYPCEMDPRDPALATCRCAVIETGPFRTFGGRCDEGACSAELLSGTSPDAPGVAQYEAGMRQVGQRFTLPAICPGNATAATPVASPVSR